MLPRRRETSRPTPNIPAYGVLVGRMIFIGGLVLALAGLGFLVMLGLAGGSWLAMLIFGTALVAGGLICGLAARDLTGSPTEQRAVVTGKQHRPEAGNPVYELKFKTVNSALKENSAEIGYNVTRLDFDRFEIGDRVVVRYSAYFKLLVDINSDQSRN